MVAGAVGKVQNLFGHLWGAIKESFKFETLTGQFKILLGSLDDARERMALLAKFAAVTPFTLEGVAKASRTLSVMSQNALGSEWSLKLVGDAAAAVNADMGELAMWVGRAYASIAAGKPFGEAAMRLTELGVLTPKVRMEMEELQAAGASNTKVWDALVAHLESFDGAMEQLSKTGDGLTSTLSDNWTAAVRTFGDAFQSAAKDSLQFLINLLGKLAADGTIEKWAKRALEALTPVKNIIMGIMGNEESRGSALSAAWDYLKAVFDYGAKAIIAAGQQLGLNIVSSIPKLANGLGRLIGLTQLNEKLSGFSAKEMEDDFVKMMYPDAKSFGESMTDAGKALKEATGAFTKAAAEAAETAKASVSVSTASDPEEAKRKEEESVQKLNEQREQARKKIEKEEGELRRKAAIEAEKRRFDEETKRLINEQKAKEDGQREWKRLQEKYLKGQQGLAVDELAKTDKALDASKKNRDERFRRAQDSDYAKEQEKAEKDAAKAEARIRKRGSALYKRLGEKMFSKDFDASRLSTSQRRLRDAMLAERQTKALEAKRNKIAEDVATMTGLLRKVKDTNEKLLTMTD